MHFPTATAAYALSLVASFSLAAADYSKAKTCTDYTIPVTPTSVNLLFAKPFVTNFDVVDFVTNIASRDAANEFHPFNGSYTATANYSISATFCTPTGKNNGVILLATHGLNFDRSYWDPSIKQGTYSFVDWAIGLGYSVWTYDRLGVGKSTLLSGYVNQISIQTSILAELSGYVKAGKYTGSFGVPKKFVLLGHSFGSELSAAVSVSQPDLADGLILTGFNFNATANNGVGFFEVFAPRIASTVHSQWDNLDTGYLTATDLYSDINAFLKAPDYEVDVAEFTHRNRQPLSVSEVISGTVADLAPVNYTGVAMVIAGQFDLIFCTSFCDDVIAHPSTEIFSKAKAFKAISFPGAGHALNFVTNHTGAFKEITDYLGANGL